MDMSWEQIAALPVFLFLTIFFYKKQDKQEGLFLDPGLSLGLVLCGFMTLMAAMNYLAWIFGWR